MIYLLIPIFIYCLSGMMDAVMDTLKTHYSISIFKDKNPLFWNPDISWRNKYINGEPEQGHKKVHWGFITFNYPDALSDAWHICKILREGFNILSIVIMVTISYTTTNVWNIILFISILSILRNNVFNLFWNKILIKL